MSADQMPDAAFIDAVALAVVPVMLRIVLEQPATIWTVADQSIAKRAYDFARTMQRVRSERNPS